MSERDNGGPAFASAGLDWHQDGMSLRDYFAGQALPVVLKWSLELTKHSEDPAPWAAASAYQMADAMLAERAKGAA